MVKHKQNKEEISVPRVASRPKSISSAVTSIGSDLPFLVKDNLAKIKQVRKSTRKSLPNIKIKKRKNSESEDKDESSNEDDLSDKNASLNGLKKKSISDSIDKFELEYAKLESPNQPFKKENICAICEMPNYLIDCQGKCQQSFHLDCIGLLKIPSGPFLCEECQNDSHMCFLCKKSPSKENNLLTFKCCHSSCGKYFHFDCIKESRLFQKEEIDTNQLEFMCPAHHCRTCYLEQGMEMSQASKGRLIKCFRCPLSYHYGEHCPPAGSIILNSNYIICPAHFRPLKNNRGHVRLNVTWCFSCCKKEDLIGCNQCPAAYHTKCLENSNKSDSFDEKDSKDEPSSPASTKLKLDQLSPLSNCSSGTNGTSNTLSSGKSHQIESDWTCQDCLLGKKPLNGQIVWAKVGIYRWWPAQICAPKYLPENLRDRPYQVGEFPVKFFGTNDFYWLTVGRCFSFAEEDESQKPTGQSKSLANAFNIGVNQAKIAFEKVEKLKNGRITIEVNKPEFQMIKSNRPVGNVIVNKCRLDEISRCECNPESPAPCSSDRTCLNRMLNHECHPSVCLAGDRCMNQRFVKRLYPKQEPFFTGSRGWGLRSLIDIKKGEFVNEYVGELITKEECKRRLDIANKNGITNFYYLTIDSNRIIDAGPKGNMSRFANHSCEPNLETQKWVVNGDIRIGLFALVDIPAFTELTFNYNLDSLSNEKAVCRCGAKNCSGFIGARPKNNSNDTKVSRSNTSIKSETSNESSASEEIKNTKKRKLNDAKKERLSICLPKSNGSVPKKRAMSLSSNEIKKLEDKLPSSNEVEEAKNNKIDLVIKKESS